MHGKSIDAAIDEAPTGDEIPSSQFMSTLLVFVHDGTQSGL
jgi:hypothetical protein